MTQPDPEWINLLLRWPEMPSYVPWEELIKSQWRNPYPPYPENRRLPLRTEDV